ncbi:restriction endonuclease subunit S [Clostridium sp. CMCC3677]|uniref:restriction endonuclease subunit S n=1 Tax=Clostridium sp. CMCC3677 TaxID=2949963 RepID=UPI0013F04712|nr:restriction endonuclease subunit S [Clostridium sp. CMCC3677]NFG61359.1 restriction endonuclease [Clostridium botulinum]NFQ09170.1 restriction endonuclease [Clostridium botulinum]
MAKKKMTLEEKIEEAIVTDVSYEVPRNWVCSKLGAVCNKVQYGYTEKASIEKLGPHFLRITDIQENEVDWDSVPYCPISKKDYTKYKLDKGDIVIARTGATTGKNYIISDEVDAVFASYLIRMKISNSIYNKFISYYMYSDLYWKQIMEEKKGIAQPGVNAQKLGSLIVPIPPLKEQQRIVDRIESLFKKLDKAKELIEESREGFDKRKSAILEKAFRGELTKGFKKVEAIFDFNIEFDEVEDKYVKEVKCKWSFCRVRDIADVKGGKRLPKGEKLVIDNTGYPYLRAGNLKDQSVLEEDIQYLTEEVQRRIKNYIITSSDVYITIVGACIGDVGVIPDKLSGANLTENAAKICNINKEVIDKTFLMKWLSSLTGQYLIKDNVLSATLGKLALTRIKEILIPLPSLEEQKEIVRILDKLLEDESKIEQLTELEGQIELIKKSILAKAFRGELGTNCEEDESALELLKEILSKE